MCEAFGKKNLKYVQCKACKKDLFCYSESDEIWCEDCKEQERPDECPKCGSESIYTTKACLNPWKEITKCKECSWWTVE